ncbi:hypothetical protein SD427_08240 [Chryseobacterium sp. JJR-5R]|uniref:hypothetical protein n=1 Tax=Chryseobacterium sp. JJR-5R TaxID=3093923 RepID=UPI002A7602A4|nr:hypothetical protein [Chryseobacterium sp. JJR-5R]WPO84311.1 hypothetical protein SD427_08240 [Chryseobacterium sp. JJR-5R]
MMHTSFRNFFVFSLLLVFLFNVSGIGTCMDHMRHSKNISEKAQHSKTEKGPSISQDDECQCALHMQMNQVLMPEMLALELPDNAISDHELPQTKAMTCRCLLDYFSSRAPPVSAYSAA